MTKVLIAAGYPLISGCLRQVVETSDDFEVVGEAVTGKDILDTLRNTPVDVLLLCMSQPESNPLDLIRRIHIELPALQICAVSFGDNARFLAMPSLRAAPLDSSRSTARPRRFTRPSASSPSGNGTWT